MGTRRHPRGPRLFVFARHAESSANLEGLLSSDPARAVGLTARGRTQAHQLGAQLANFDIDLAVCSCFLRTRQTLELAPFSAGREGKGCRCLLGPWWCDLEELEDAALGVGEAVEFDAGVCVGKAESLEDAEHVTSGGFR
jgi:hypothetical protein